MEVHTHTHSPRKKWLHYFYEFLMLFLAVFCGFLAENLREHKIEHKRAGQYAGMMKEDLLKDTAQLGELVRGTEGLKTAQRIYKKVYGLPLDNITVADLNSLSEPGIDMSLFIWNDATYSQMKSSGSLRLFTDIHFIRKLALYEYWIKALSTFNNFINDAMRSEFTLKANYHKNKFFEANPGLKETDLLKQRGYNFDAWEMQDALNRRIISNQLILREIYPEIIKIAGEVIDLLNKEYHLK